MPSAKKAAKRGAPMPLEEQLTMDAVVQPKKAKAPKARRQQPDEEVRADAGEAAATRRTHSSCRPCAVPPLPPARRGPSSRERRLG